MEVFSVPSLGQGLGATSAPLPTPPPTPHSLHPHSIPTQQPLTPRSRWTGWGVGPSPASSSVHPNLGTASRQGARPPQAASAHSPAPASRGTWTPGPGPPGGRPPPHPCHSRSEAAPSLAPGQWTGTTFSRALLAQPRPE